MPVILAPLVQAFSPIGSVGRCCSERSTSAVSMAREEKSEVINRRSMLSFVAVATASSVLGVERATALDMDAFMNSEVRDSQT